MVGCSGATGRSFFLPVLSLHIADEPAFWRNPFKECASTLDNSGLGHILYAAMLTAIVVYFAVLKCYQLNSITVQFTFID